MSHSHSHGHHDAGKKADIWTRLQVGIDFIEQALGKSVSVGAMITDILELIADIAPIKLWGYSLPFSWQGLAIAVPLVIVIEAAAASIHETVLTNHQPNKSKHQATNETAPLYSKEMSDYTGEIPLGRSSSSESEESPKSQKRVDLNWWDWLKVGLDFGSHMLESTATYYFLAKVFTPTISDAKRAKLISLGAGLAGTLFGGVSSVAEARKCKRNLEMSKNKDVSVSGFNKG